MNRSKLKPDSFIIEKDVLTSWDDWVPLSYKLNTYDTNKSFTLVIFKQTKERYEFVFCCRLYYINAKKRKQIGIGQNIRYELGDVFLMPEYWGASFDGIKYSKLCLELVDQFLAYENIQDIILWTWKDNIKAIKRYQDLGFVSVDNPKVRKYYTKVAKRYGYTEEDLRVFWRQE